MPEGDQAPQGGGALVAGLASCAVLLAISGLAGLAPRFLLVLTGSALLAGLLAAATDLQIGVGGILSLGPALFFGIGAYSVALAANAGLPFVAGLAAGCAIAVLAAALIGVVALNARQTSIQFALLMLIASLGGEQIIVSGYDWSGGSNGIAGLAPPPSLGLRWYFALLGAVVLALLLLLHRVASGRFGWLLRLQAAEPEMAESLGYDVKLAKITCSCLTAAIAAIGGAFYAPLNGIAFPAMFGVQPNMLVLVWIALGGAGTLLGPFAAGLILTLVQFELGSQLVNWFLLAIGAGFVLTVVAAPRGLFHFLSRT